MKDRLGNPLVAGAFIVYSVHRSGLNFYRITLVRKDNVQVEPIFFRSGEKYGFTVGRKISLNTPSHMLVIPAEMLPIYENAPQ